MLERRTLRLSVSQEILPLTSLMGTEFVKAWLEAVKLHAFLWSCDIKYGDPNLSNVMYDQELKCGVLIDYDLPLSRQQPGTDTGSIPFMALALLNYKYWNGEIVRLYRHGFEAFLWILPFVFLRYQDGKPEQGTPVDAWMTSSYTTCREKKSDFWPFEELVQKREVCQLDFRDHWVLVQELVSWWFEWLQATNRKKRGGAPLEVENSVRLLWPLFVNQLKLIAKEDPSLLIYIDTLIDELQLEKEFWLRHDVPEA